jgi:hypothetical protein
LALATKLHVSDIEEVLSVLSNKPSVAEMNYNLNNFLLLLIICKPLSFLSSSSCDSPNRVYLDLCSGNSVDSTHFPHTKPKKSSQGETRSSIDSSILAAAKRLLNQFFPIFL